MTPLELLDQPGRSATVIAYSSLKAQILHQMLLDKWFQTSFILVCVCLVASVVSDPAILWTAARRAPLSMGFSRQEYGSGLPCPSPGDLPHSGMEPVCLALQADSLLLSH